MTTKVVGPVEASREIRRLSTLLDISQALTGTLDLRSALHHVLEILERHHRVPRGAIVLLDDDGRELFIAASLGLPVNGQRARYRVGEGITGRVVDTGKPVLLPQASREPLFLNRAGQRTDLDRHEVTFVCVPLVASRKTVGALWLDLPFKRDRDYDRSLKFYRVVGSIIAQSVKVHGLVQAEKQRLLAENTQLRDELQERHALRNMIGTSGPMRGMYEQVAQVARTNTTVLIRGESGTGKEMIAHAIHYSSSRARKPFIRVNCGALPDTLIESELFGYEKGAFTGAQTRKKGRFELAEGGTLFLDEIGDLNPQTQVKLLRVLQEREFERLGGTTTIKVNVRLIAATHRDLETAIADGGFREDLYYRLNVFTIFAPPLRERKADVMLLADHFLEKYSAEHGNQIKRISTPAIDMLVSYHWPGNVRELENTIERAVLVCNGSVIHAHHLPPTLQTAEASGTVPRLSLTESVESYEKDLLQDAVKTTRGNGAKAAKLLNTTERILHYKIQKYGIDLERFKR
ncbi:MAG TPA: sigma 54-interacting transcriptional regulator [Luteitalea sp.]|nr:sigma 54-interacting transcriptional regulator [Luteitalea sp.]